MPGFALVKLSVEILVPRLTLKILLSDKSMVVVEAAVIALLAFK